MPSGAAVIRYDGARGVVWRIKFTDAAGVQVQETLGPERDGWTRKRAEAELRDRLVRVERKAWRKPASVKFAEFAERWLAESEITEAWKPKTVVAYRNVVRHHLVPAFRDRTLDSIRARDVAEYVRRAISKPHSRYKRPLSPATIGVHLNVLHAIYKAAVVEELVQANPAAGARRPKGQRREWRILEPHEVPRVAAAFSEPIARRMFLTMILTGLRRFELLDLRWAEVDLLDQRLRVRESKSEAGERSIAIPATLAAELRTHYAGAAYRADTDYVFSHPTKGSRVSQEWYAEQFRSALAEAGITDYLRPFHDARHAALTNMAATGASPIAIMTTAGHRSMATTRQYLHLAGVVFPDDAAALEARLLGSSVQTAGTNPAEKPVASQTR